MKEKILERLMSKSIDISAIGERIAEICSSNGAVLKTVHADLASCVLKISTEQEDFEINYQSFNPVNQCISFQ